MTRKRSDTKSSEPRTPRAVRVSCAANPDGHVAVTVSVDPAEDLDAAGGVFVDVILAGSDRTTRRAEFARSVPAIAIRSVSSVSPRVPNDPRRLGPAVPAKTARPRVGPRAYTAHLIAPGRQLARGRPETFRSEIVLTGASPTGLSWFVRGRFAQLDGGEALRSTWVRVDDTERIS